MPVLHANCTFTFLLPTSIQSREEVQLHELNSVMNLILIVKTNEKLNHTSI